MSYSIDLRKRVVNYVENGGRIAQAAGLFKVGRATIYRWLGRTDLRATQVKRRKIKLDWQALEKDVKENPDTRLIDRAKKFGVRPSAISYALKEMKITRKKKELRYQERNREARMKYYRYLRELIKVSGSQSRVFIDESGEPRVSRLCLWLVKKRQKNLGRKVRKTGEKRKSSSGSTEREKGLNCPNGFYGQPQCRRF